MAEAGETSLAPPSSSADRPLVVRVKRKPSQSPLEAFWLEISERPLKRALLDLEKLSLSASHGQEFLEESRPKRVFVKHVETVRNSEATIGALQPFVASLDLHQQHGTDGGSKSIASSRARHTFRKDNKQIQLLSRAKQDQEALAKSARFEQIWRSRRGNKEAVHDEALHEACRLYDVVRIDIEGTSKKANEQKAMSKEDQDSLSKFLPMLKELVPEAADDIESDMRSCASEQETTGGFVYDLYTVEDDPPEVDDSHPFPLVQVEDDDEWFDGLDDSEYETDDSNAENHPFNDYPDEESDNEDEAKSDTDESEEEESGSEVSAVEKDPKHLAMSDDEVDNDYYDSDHLEDARNACSDSEDGVESDDSRWAYR